MRHKTDVSRRSTLNVGSNPSMAVGPDSQSFRAGEHLGLRFQPIDRPRQLEGPVVIADLPGLVDTIPPAEDILDRQD